MGASGNEALGLDVNPFILVLELPFCYAKRDKKRTKSQRSERMIFYISGTGNSHAAAKKIAAEQNEKLVSISENINSSAGPYVFTLQQDEIIGFVFPVYAWAPPQRVLQFIEKLTFHNYQDNYIFSLATCGENIGNTMQVLAAALQKKNLQLQSGFSLRMPNNYIILGNVDSPAEAKEKLTQANDSLGKINQVIRERSRGVFEVRKGFLPGLLTAVVNPLFNKNAISTKNFYADDKCTGCGICAKVCNCRSITVQGKPQWGEQCMQCLACLHYCPVGALQYGRGTAKKGRYRNPDVAIAEISN